MLGSLVLAMSVTAALLGWLDSGALDAADPKVVARIAESARRAVLEVSAEADRQRWAEVHIEPEESAGGVKLAAASGPVGQHFVIGLDGRVSASAAWRGASNGSSASDGLRVGCVLSSKFGPSINRVQWVAVHTLMAELRARYETRGRALSVRLHADLESEYGLPKGRIHVPDSP